LGSCGVVRGREDLHYFHAQEKRRARTHAEDKAKQDGNGKTVRFDERAETPNEADRNARQERAKHADTVDEQPGRDLDYGMRQVDGTEKKRKAAITHTENIHELIGNGWRTHVNEADPYGAENREPKICWYGHGISPFLFAGIHWPFSLSLYTKKATPCNGKRLMASWH
jgi:hypothetical protein